MCFYCSLNIHVRAIQRKRHNQRKPFIYTHDSALIPLLAHPQKSEPSIGTIRRRHFAFATLKILCEFTYAAIKVVYQVNVFVEMENSKRYIWITTTATVAAAKKKTINSEWKTEKFTGTSRCACGWAAPISFGSLIMKPFVVSMKYGIRRIEHPLLFPFGIKYRIYRLTAWGEFRHSVLTSHCLSFARSTEQRKFPPHTHKQHYGHATFFPEIFHTIRKRKTFRRKWLDHGDCARLLWLEV